MDAEDEGDLVRPTEGNAVIGSSFIGSGTHILLDTYLPVLQLTKAAFTMIYYMCLVISLQNNAAEQQNIMRF